MKFIQFLIENKLLNYSDDDELITACGDFKKVHKQYCLYCQYTKQSCETYKESITHLKDKLGTEAKRLHRNHLTQWYYIGIKTAPMSEVRKIVLQNLPKFDYQ